MERVQIGTKVATLGINKVSVADGTSARVVLIDRDPACKYVAYDADLGKRVEVNQDLLIKYCLKAAPTFYFLVARLNTDLKGNVSDDSFTVEYLQLSSTVYNELADAIEENPQFTSFKLSKVSKKMGDKDFSYIKPTTSNYQVPQTILDKIATLTQDQKDAMWTLIDRATSMTAAEYDALRSNTQEYDYRVQSRAAMIAGRSSFGAPQAAPAPQAPSAPQIAAPQSAPQQTIGYAQYQAPAPQAPVQDMPSFGAPQAPADFAQSNDFGAPTGDAFDF